jgi:hypothetical protein
MSLGDKFNASDSKSPQRAAFAAEWDRQFRFLPITCQDAINTNPTATRRSAFRERGKGNGAPGAASELLKHSLYMGEKEKPPKTDEVRMRTYLVIIKSYAQFTIDAYDYTENAEDGRIYFHKTKDKSDKKTFFSSAWLIAIMEIPKRETVVVERSN